MRIKRTAGLLAPPKSHWPASHRWRVLAIGFAANAAFSAAISGLPAAAVLMCQGYQLSTAQLGIAHHASKKQPHHQTRRSPRAGPVLSVAQRPIAK